MASLCIILEQQDRDAENDGTLIGVHPRQRIRRPRVTYFQLMPEPGCVLLSSPCRIIL